MHKQRGFRPQGLIAPIQKIKYNGPTLLDKINRDTRPTWDDLKDRIKNQEGNKMLEDYENSKYLNELNKNREKKIKEQEKKFVKKLKKKYKKKNKKKSDDYSTDSYNNNHSKKSKRIKRKKIKKNSLLSSYSYSSDSDKRKYKNRKYDDINPFKLSSFFKME